jgi:hypothetical protein
MAKPSVPVTEAWRHANRIGNVPALPVNESDAAVRGVVTSARASLTTDETALYSEFDVRVDEVLKPAAGVEVGASLTALRFGGALQVPSGLIRARQADQTMPVTGGTYVLFLKRHSPDDPAFLLIVGYRLEAGVLVPWIYYLSRCVSMVHQKRYSMPH